MRPSLLKIALTIAGSDPTGGAGFQADLKTFKAMGVYGLSIPAVLTAQNTRGVSSIHEVSPEFFSDELDMLLKDVTPDAVKTGMLYTSEIVEGLSRRIKERSLKNIVVDPVTVSSTGVSLAKAGTLNAIKRNLFPLARVITPNIHEAYLLSGIEVSNENDMKDVARKLRALGPEEVIITGGHLKDKAMDMLFDGEEFLFLENERLEGEFHGTGCAFSSAIAAGIALGYDVKESAVKAKEFVFNAMKNAIPLGKGMKILNI
ncbi:MAG: bifunctional hydroxymethylpyrimidine kinase/phosphomethylpyrimidine kinase [Nitrospirae bacterium]|nr:bifunctional hydroxymethylpyrimidine kinase/phosphomethylpyrimidine kinase [Nitrospirota bacterium]